MFLISKKMLQKTPCCQNGCLSIEVRQVILKKAYKSLGKTLLVKLLVGS